MEKSAKLLTMYKVQLFTDGNILTVARHELEKGLPGDLIFNSHMYNHFSIPKKVTSSTNIQPESADIGCLFETSVLDTADGS